VGGAAKGFAPSGRPLAYNKPVNRQDVDSVVIGAGVIGLAVARALAASGREVLVVEANSGIGLETSSRHSEVIHAGLYYAPGSLKALSCVRGKTLLYTYCREKGVPHQRLGKLVVASHPEQLGALTALKDNAAACGVPDLQLLDAHRLELMEPAVRAAGALWSPSTGIIDSHALMLSLQADLEADGGTVACNTRVEEASVSSSGIELRVQGEGSLCLRARSVVNAAGLAAVGLARHISGLPTASIPRVKLVRGHYFSYRGRSPFSHLVYPLPEHDGLGIHGTLDLAGRLRFGPDAEPIARVDYAFDDSRRRSFADAIRPWFPDLEEDRLQAAYTGIRPKLMTTGKAVADFQISGPADHGAPGLINLFGIESPGLTACLALAEQVAQRLEAA
jgi:L-2-hydroxyglutarate oxidase LhgO